MPSASWWSGCARRQRGGKRGQNGKDGKGRNRRAKTREQGREGPRQFEKPLLKSRQGPPNLRNSSLRTRSCALIRRLMAGPFALSPCLFLLNIARLLSRKNQKKGQKPTSQSRHKQRRQNGFVSLELCAENLTQICSWVRSVAFQSLLAFTVVSASIGLALYFLQDREDTTNGTQLFSSFFHP